MFDMLFTEKLMVSLPVWPLLARFPRSAAWRRLSFPALRAKTFADSEPELLRRRSSPEERLMPAVAKEENCCSGGQTVLTEL